MTYTRGEQVLKPTEVEYLFTKAHDNLGLVENQIRSLADHFRGVKPELANKLEVAVSNVIIARATVHGSTREGVNHGMSHRNNAGELEY